MLAATAILSITASVGYGLVADARRRKRERQTAAPRRAAGAARTPKRTTATASPASRLVSLGALIHTLLAIKGAMRRLFRRRPRPALGSAPPPRAPWLNRESPDFAAPLDEFAPAVETASRRRRRPRERARRRRAGAAAPLAAPAGASRVAAPSAR